jgi:DNA modification methylase
MKRLINTSNVINRESRGKNLDSLKKSRQIRSDFISKFGYVPESIIKQKAAKGDFTSTKAGRRYIETSMLANKQGKGFTKEEISVFGLSGMSCRGKKGALSVFPQDVGRLMIEFYSKENDVIYDPFAGHNSRMSLAFNCRRNYIGVDISNEFMKDNREIKKILLKKQDLNLFKNKCRIRLLEQSSDDVNLPDEFADFTITSPPYWDIEYYGDEEQQLGKNKTYKAFLNSITKHIEENFRLLKKGSYCCWFINDFVKDKVYYSYHSDLINIFREAGFELFTTYIIDLGRSIMSAFVQSIINSKRFPKRHEYCLVFKKPGE